MIDNSCKFIGRITRIDQPKVKQGGPNGQFTEVTFSIACRKRLSQADQNLKAQGQQVKDAYFVPLKASGANADNILKWFQVGDPIMVEAHYDEYSYPDTQNPGKNKYGHSFIIEEWGFVPGVTLKGSQQQQQGVAPQGQYQPPMQQGYAPQQNFQPQGQQNQDVNNNINANGQYQVAPNLIPF